MNHLQQKLANNFYQGESSNFGAIRQFYQGDNSNSHNHNGVEFVGQYKRNNGNDGGFNGNQGGSTRMGVRVIPMQEIFKEITLVLMALDFTLNQDSMVAILEVLTIEAVVISLVP